MKVSIKGRLQFCTKNFGLKRLQAKSFVTEALKYNARILNLYAFLYMCPLVMSPFILCYVFLHNYNDIYNCSSLTEVNYNHLSFIDHPLKSISA